MRSRSIVKESPLRDHVAAVSCGIFNATPVIDLDYAEDSTAETDANFVLTGSGGLVEIQATAEVAVFSQDELSAMLALAQQGVAELIALQKAALA
jgi:ribonuclease PH